MMESFDFSHPTKVYFGPNREDEIGDIVSAYSGTRCLLVYGQGSIKANGLLDRVEKSLAKSHISFVELGGVRPNPTIDLVRKGISLVKEHNIDFILPIGGGSAIDTGKLIAIGSKYDGDPFDISLHKAEAKDRLPIGCILTIAGSGSEMSSSCVIQDDGLKRKAGFNSEFNKPLFAVENPCLTYSVGKRQTAIGTVDMMTHVMERYFSESSSFEPGDRIAEGLLKGIMEVGRVAFDEPESYEARSALMIYSSMAHNGVASIGKAYRMSVHQLEHSLSGLYPEVAHGEGLAVLFPAWMKYYSLLDVDKFDKFARNVFSLDFPNKADNARMGIAHLEEFFKELGMPSTLSGLGIKNPNVDALVNNLTVNGTRVVGHHVKPMDQRVATDIFRSVL